MSLGIGLLALTSTPLLTELSGGPAVASSQTHIEAPSSSAAIGAAQVLAQVAAPHVAQVQAAKPAQKPPQAQPRQEATMMPTPTAPVIPVFVLPEIPTKIQIPAIKVNTKVQPVGPGKTVSNLGLEWTSPKSRNVGWHDYSGQLGQSRNMVMNGHNNIYGGIFRKLYTLQAGDLITVSSPSYWRTYVVTEVMILKEKGEPYEVLQQNASYISPLVQEDRLTLISCWPETNNTHRVIVLAKPVAQNY